MLASPPTNDVRDPSDRSAPRFFAWCTAAVFRVVAEGPPLPLAAVEAAWTIAGREIAARLGLACARERLVAASSDGTVLLPSHQPAISVPVARRGPFGLHQPDLDAPRQPVLEHPNALLAVLAADLGLWPAQLHRLASELADSRFHLAVARVIAELRVRARLAARPWPAPLDPENLVIAGHPWHPMCKMRGHMHLHEILRTAPEALGLAQVYAVDVDRSLIREAGQGDAAELFPAAPRGMVRVPVHGLQWRRLPQLLADVWGHGVHPSPVAPRPARALLSMRTVEIDRRHLKLSSLMHTTSAVRQVSPASVANGPPLAQLLRRIFAADPHVRRGLAIQPDLAAAGLEPSALARDPDRAGQLGMIVRPVPEACLGELVGDTSVTTPQVWCCAALGERWPGASEELHGRVVSTPQWPRQVADLAALDRTTQLLHRSAGPRLLETITAAYPSPLEALQHYVDLLVPPALRLCVAHGIALELHLQNTLVVHANGRLCGFVNRDLGGVRIARPSLRAAGCTLPDEGFVVTNDPAEVYNKLAHTMLHAHLSAVFTWAASLPGIDEAACWAYTRAKICSSLAMWAAAEPGLAAACTAARAVLLAPQVAAKCLLHMRITEQVSEYMYTQVANPLA